MKPTELDDQHLAALALVGDSDSALTLWEMGGRCYEAGTWERASFLLRAAADIARAQGIELPVQCKIWVALGRALTKEGKWEEAERWLRQAVGAADGQEMHVLTRSSATEALADLLARSGRREEAQGFAERWRALMRPFIPPPPEPLLIRLIVFLVRRSHQFCSGAGPEEEFWELRGGAAPQVELPTEVARAAYGVDGQPVNLRLHRFQNEGGSVRPRLEVYPGPRCPLSFIIAAGGPPMEFQVGPADEEGESSFSAIGEALPAGTLDLKHGQEVDVSVRIQ